MKKKAAVRRVFAAALATFLLLAVGPLSASAAIDGKDVISTVTAKDHTLASSFTFDKIEMVDFTAVYPDFGSAQKPVLSAIDKAYYDKAFAFYNFVSNGLVKSAVEDYHNALKEGYPFRFYGADMKTTITLNANSILSTYTDQYQYLGGAHGTTVRSSDTWSLATGHRVRMKDLFKKTPNYRAVLLQKILKIADSRMQPEPVYFDNYRTLITKYFNTDNFYLTANGLAIYFQQYEVAPYAAGFVTFEIPYAELGIQLSYKTLP